MPPIEENLPFDLEHPYDPENDIPHPEGKEKTEEEYQ